MRDAKIEPTCEVVGSALSTRPNLRRMMNDVSPAMAVNAILLPFTLLAAGVAGEAQPKVLRDFRDTALIELSPDGHSILTSNLRRVKCVDGKNSCFNQVLSVYDAATNKLIGQLISSKPLLYGITNYFLTPEFVDQGRVRTIQSTWDNRRNATIYVSLTWDSISGTEHRTPIEFPRISGISVMSMMGIYWG